MVRVRKMQLQSWKNFLVSPITKSTLVYTSMKCDILHSTPPSWISGPVLNDELTEQLAILCRHQQHDADCRHHGAVPRTQQNASNLTKRPHRRRTWTVQSYSPGGAYVHHHQHASLSPPQHKRHPDRFSRF